MSNKEIDGKVVAITGASSGIGEATARLLASRGAKVVLAARRSARIELIASDLVEKGYAASSHTTDVRHRSDLQSLVAHTLTRFGRLDVLVSNAGVGPISRFDELRVDDWDMMIDINLRGVLHGIAAALPVFRQQHAGHFVHTISTAGLRIVPSMGVYAATKNAVRTLSEALRQEAGETLRVTLISPGFVQSEFSDSIPNEAIRSSILKRSHEGLPPEAIARAIAFAIEQPADVDVGDIVVRPTSQD